ncbi:hypothetical protein [Lysinibacillus telephonicus]|nr:hypothetical protein [Lysinibacillus telephonicus]
MGALKDSHFYLSKKLSERSVNLIVQAVLEQSNLRRAAKQAS